MVLLRRAKTYLHYREDVRWRAHLQAFPLTYVYPAEGNVMGCSFNLKEALVAAAFPHPVTQIETHETHISWIVLTGVFAYKIKKNVHFDFIDTTTLAQRRHLCEEEVRLNRRLAPDLYVDVVAITREANGLRFGGQGPAIEYAVRMKQFDRTQELLTLLTRSEVTIEEITDLAVTLARFHSEAPAAPCTADFRYTEQLRSAALGNLENLRQELQHSKGFSEIGQLDDWTRNYLQCFEKDLNWREQCGFIRECHGDLHARNIVRWNGHLTPFDCLEFDPRLRWIDVMSDVAFLIMDLVDHDRGDLAFVFLNRHTEITGDYAGLQLLPFYAVYRSLVRAKVDALSAKQRPERHAQYLERLRSRVRTARDFMHPSPPSLIIMHGLSGSGKSWLSERLIPMLPAIRIRSDIERKRLATSDEPHLGDSGLKQGIYTPEFSHRAYARLLDCAKSCLQGGVNTIVDAAFLSSEDRQTFQELAAHAKVRYVILSCAADPAVLAARIVRRQQLSIDPSDANLAVLEHQLHSGEPLSSTEQLYVVTIDTSDTSATDAAMAALRQRLIV